MWLTDPSDIFMFGDFFNTVVGEKQSSWRGRFLDQGGSAKVNCCCCCCLSCD